MSGHPPYGSGPVPVPVPVPVLVPGRGKELGVRIAWSLFPILSVGLAAWVPMLVLALRRRTGQAWGVFAGFVAGVILTFVLFAVEGSESDRAERERGAGAEVTGLASIPGNVGAALLLAMWIGGSVYWFVATRERPSAAAVPTGPAYHHPVMGQPVPGPAYAWPHPQFPPPAPPPAATPPPTATPPSDAHAERARARLEGLSERLRERQAPGAPDAPGGPR